ncbi:MAG: carboxylating nicotinate-nucleotide diphosphorylase [Gemmatimonadales bacterium]
MVSAEEIAADAQRLAALALAEDGARDLTSLVTVVPDQRGRARIVARSAVVASGIVYADALLFAAELPTAEWRTGDGDHVEAGGTICHLHGPLAGLFRAERPMLNMLQRACGVATLTSRFVDAIAPARCVVLHTRKTTPGLRILEIAAVLDGGGKMHRRDLAGALLVKDNHWAAMQTSGRTLAEALEAARRAGARMLGVEVETSDELDTACAAGATRLLIDNQTPDIVREWSARARQLSPGIEIEASGGITLDNAREYAMAGADFISVGALTGSPPRVDLSMEVRSEK